MELYLIYFLFLSAHCITDDIVYGTPPMTYKTKRKSSNKTIESPNDKSTATFESGNSLKEFVSKRSINTTISKEERKVRIPRIHPLSSGIWNMESYLKLENKNMDYSRKRRNNTSNGFRKMYNQKCPVNFTSDSNSRIIIIQMKNEMHKISELKDKNYHKCHKKSAHLGFYPLGLEPFWLMTRKIVTSPTRPWQDQCCNSSYGKSDCSQKPWICCSNESRTCNNSTTITKTKGTFSTTRKNKKSKTKRSNARTTRKNSKDAVSEFVNFYAAEERRNREISSMVKMDLHSSVTDRFSKSNYVPRRSTELKSITDPKVVHCSLNGVGHFISPEKHNFELFPYFNVQTTTKPLDHCVYAALKYPSKSKIFLKESLHENRNIEPIRFHVTQNAPLQSKTTERYLASMNKSINGQTTDLTARIKRERFFYRMLSNNERSHKWKLPWNYPRGNEEKKFGLKIPNSEVMKFEDLDFVESEFVHAETTTAHPKETSHEEVAKPCTFRPVSAKKIVFYYLELANGQENSIKTRIPQINSYSSPDKNIDMKQNKNVMHFPEIKHNYRTLSVNEHTTMVSVRLLENIKGKPKYYLEIPEYLGDILKKASDKKPLNTSCRHQHFEKWNPSVKNQTIFQSTISMIG